ncbi:uncharacterized protein [Primulina huaijiensis]|uniref:uncharacterized protein n=1 Tax=Primulina huaijiensis TaxID=1492673 RepID=UPI003CC76C9F
MGLIKMISGGSTDGDSNRARKSRSRRECMEVEGAMRSEAVISFGPEDLNGVNLPDNDALMDLQGYHLEAVETALFGFAGHVVYPEGEIILPLTLGSQDCKKTVMTSFTHQKIKFLVGARVGEVRGDQPSSHKCYVEAVRADQSKSKRERKKVRVDEVGGRMGEKEEVHFLAEEEQEMELTGISPMVSEHQLNILPGSHPVKRKKRHFGPEKDKVIDEQVKELLRAGATYQRLMNKVFEKQLGRNVEVYVDDILGKSREDLKIHLAELPVLVKPEPGEKLFVYLSATEYAVSSVLVKEEGSDQKPLYYVSHALRGPELCLAGCGVGVVIVSPTGERIKLAIKIDSRVTNNEAEYEAVLAGIRAAQEIGASRVILYSDSQLITQQIKGVYEVKDDRMLKYLQLIKTQAKIFVDWGIEQIPREENGEADALAKMAASLSEVSTWEVLHVSRLNLSTDKEALPAPEDSWMTFLIRFIEAGELPEDKIQAQKIKRQAPRFVLLNKVLYRRSFQGLLLKCLSEGEVDYVLREIHEGCCAEHLGGTALTRKTMLSGFWWPTLSQDSTRIVRSCENCKYHSNFQHIPATPMKPIWASCPFDQWGMDIVGPFPIVRAQKKFLLVAVDYFSKLVEAEALAKITEQEVLKLIWRNIICRFGVPRRLISDNGRQFQGREITSWLQGKGRDWVEELPSVLWAYRTTPRAPTQETPFNLVYGAEAVLPVEIGQTSSRVESYPNNNDQSRAMELDLVEEKRDRASIRMEAYRGRIVKSYNKKVRNRNFQIGDLVMKKVNPPGYVGKLEARWEGPYKITQKVSSRSIYL